jgi:hypothetical protein
MGFLFSRWILVGALLLPAWGAGAGEPGVDELESEVAELRSEIADLKRLVEDLRASRETALAAGRAEAPARRPRLPDISIGGFADVTYSVLRQDGEGTSNFFTLGDLDFFVTSQLSDRMSFLAEVLFEFEDLDEFGGSGGSFAEIERLLFKYEHADWLNVKAGRSHLPIGYWNVHFHHGTWLQTTVRRPLVFKFEDDGGILPMHSVGLEISGSLGSERGLFTYAGGVGNGRGPRPEDVQNLFDRNDAKMFTAQLTFHPADLPGFVVGANVLSDKIPKDRAVPARDESIRELIAGAQLLYLADPFEVMAEGQMVRHRSSGTSFYSHGGYGQLAYRIGRLKPYYRFDWLEVDPNDPFYLDLESAQDTRQHTVGIRFDWTPFAALKMEYERQSTDDDDRDLVVGQLSFAF